jgi:hypothetical protein
MPPALLWGVGTAIGEIPPYAFSYHAAKAGIRNEEWDNMFQVTPVAEGQGIVEALVNRMKNWMLRFIQKCVSAPRLPCPATTPSLAPCCNAPG